MFTLNGFGTTFVGECDYEPDGTYVTTAWIVALWVSLIPLYSARVLSVEPTMLSGTNYQIIKQPVHWGQARRIWAYTLGIPALLALFVWLAVGAMLAYALLPFFLRYRACKAIGLRYKELKVSPITWLAIVLLLLAIGYGVFFGNKP